MTDLVNHGGPLPPPPHDWQERWRKLESELSTWKTRAEKAEKENIHLQNQADYWKETGLNESRRWWEKSKLFEAERDTLKARCEKLEAKVIQLENELKFLHDRNASRGDHS